MADETGTTVGTWAAALLDGAADALRDGTPQALGDEHLTPVAVVVAVLEDDGGAQIRHWAENLPVLQACIDAAHTHAARIGLDPTALCAQRLAYPLGIGSAPATQTAREDFAENANEAATIVREATTRIGGASNGAGSRGAFLVITAYRERIVIAHAAATPWELLAVRGMLASWTTLRVVTAAVANQTAATPERTADDDRDDADPPGDRNDATPDTETSALDPDIDPDPGASAAGG